MVQTVKFRRLYINGIIPFNLKAFWRPRDYNRFLLYLDMTIGLCALQISISLYMRVKYFVSVPFGVWSDAELWSPLMTEIASLNPTEVAEVRHNAFLVYSVGTVLGNGVITLTVLAVITFKMRKTVMLHTIEILFNSFDTYRRFWILTTLIDRYKKVTSYFPLSPGPTPVHLHLWFENNHHIFLTFMGPCIVRIF